jgi:hypothetical protein
MILYCMTPHGLQCPPNYLWTYQSLKERVGDDHANHVMEFHLWCSSNIIMDDSIRLQLFQRTLTGPLAKWYVEEKSGSHTTFESLAKEFLTFFQLPIFHNNGLELLLISIKPQLHISLTTFTSGIGYVVCAKQKPPSNSVSTGFFDHLSLSLVRM